ncbi:MAG: efflux transporter periplasmic adaptor subunit, partial [Deltaproteobacteria bacterium]
TAKARKVKTGVKSAQLVQIIDGVKPGEKVITTGTIALFDGAPIKYQPKITKKAEAKTTTQ